MAGPPWSGWTRVVDAGFCRQSRSARPSQWCGAPAMLWGGQHQATEVIVVAFSKIAAAGLLSVVMGTSMAQSAEIVVLATTAAQDALTELVPLFERASGHKINITYGQGPRMADRI